ncbi:lasso peptide biosynthesis PqqD family chaperone [Streptomyces sp. VRA16 Mangrove soil]|uniref:lasso peptide biosynthesis PqqD family chaperone n=1 Tax=Streptomyces sp. VRA16 Mangrove soil TaxID=2817434 RepID=UPI001A9FF41C|nr:lasso peptide biosynthesis PqqD family chaperone [Streptomyces sp. VRA16 Mangrove soil]MBO1336286.1 lasso peptide biosynthesis PqqD family chaperone [Streptomyces sp. VRA16 Mangrove soil]
MKLKDGIAVTRTDYGGVLLDQRGGAYWQLNDSGTLILTTLTEGHDLATAVDRLVEAYDIDRARAEADVAELAQQLVDAEMATP